jgi:nucleotide-binding universal stress UspA family protein
LLLGSVAEKILRACKRSVLISRGDAGASGFRRIVVPTDFSPLAELAAEVARTVAARGAIVQLVHCWQLPVMLLDYQGTLAPIARDLQHEARTRGRQSVARLRSAEIDVSFTDLEGPPAYVISELVEQRNAELVVIGSHGLRGWRRLLLGSVAETTARHATCSVLVARDPSIKE